MTTTSTPRDTEHDVAAIEGRADRERPAHNIRRRAGCQPHDCRRSSAPTLLGMNDQNAFTLRAQRGRRGRCNVACANSASSAAAGCEGRVRLCGVLAKVDGHARSSSSNTATNSSRAPSASRYSRSVETRTSSAFSNLEIAAWVMCELAMRLTSSSTSASSQRVPGRSRRCHRRRMSEIRSTCLPSSTRPPCRSTACFMIAFQAVSRTNRNGLVAPHVRHRAVYQSMQGGSPT